MPDKDWQAIINVAKTVKELLGPEVVVSVTDLEKFIFYTPGNKLNHGISPGDPVKPDSLTEKALLTKKRVIAKADSKIYGVAYIGKGAPIFDSDGQMVGSMFVSNPTTSQDTLMEGSIKLEAAMDVIISSSNDLSAASQQLAATAAGMASQSQKITEDVKRTEIVSNLIREVAAQTHLLGLNAAIEAARAGDIGRGFNVVAKDIRALANRTHASVKEITEVLKKVILEVGELSEQVFQIAAVSDEQAKSVEKLSSTILEIASMSKDLKSIAKELVG